VTDSPAEWDASGVEDLGGGIYRIPLPLPSDALRAVNVYAICEGEDVVLIDGGWALSESQRQLEKSFSEIGLSLSQIRRVLVTHVHRDHYTQAVSLREQFGCHVALGSGERANLFELLAAFSEQRMPRQFEALRRAGAGRLMAQLRNVPANDSEQWQVPDEWLEADARLHLGSRTLRVISTPGHTAGHVVFHDESANLLFAGDHVLPHITPSIGFQPSLVPFPLRDYLASLRLVAALPDARLLPAHGMVTDSVHKRVSALLAHHEARLEASLAVVRAGAPTAYEVAEILRWTRRERDFAELDPFNQLLAVSETLAHLDVLVLQERLRTVRTDEGVDHFELPPARR
jgi:glyoxylase-like metal-dependent hydrolase (beta-lactamase superfamily II)